MKIHNMLSIVKILNIIFFCLFFLILGSVFFYINPLKPQPSLFLDLSGPWRICIPNTINKPILTNCRFNEKINVPHYNSPNIHYKNYHWLIYKKFFYTPPQCLKQDSLCSLIIGEIGDSAEIWLNGNLIGSTSEASQPIYSKNFPIKVDLPTVTFKNKNQMNKIEIVVYSMKVPQSGIRGSPIGITGQNIANDFVRSKVTLTVIFPIFSALILIFFALFSFSFAGISQENKKVLIAYRCFCVCYSLFLISFSELPRSFLPMWVAAHLHFLFRYMGDWSLFYLVVVFFRFKGKKILGLHMLYLIAILIFIFSFLYCLLSSSEIKNYIGAILPYSITKKIFPLKLLPMVSGLIGSFYWKEKKEKLILFLLFFMLVLMQVNDILVFLEFYSNIYFVKFYIAIIAIILGMMIFKNIIISEKNHVDKLARQAASVVVAKQVAHDIRSPLAALNILTMQDMPVTEQSKILVRNAINRIRDIANDIVDKNRDLRRTHINTNDTSTQLLAAIIYPLITEKRLQFRSSSKINIEIELTPDNYGLFVKIKLSEFKRMLSNIINNAIEALPGKGTVLLRIYNKNNLIHLNISDNGRGISPSILDQLGLYGVTYDKPSGSGLGLYHAKKTMEEFGGKLEITSELNKGTEVTLIFPHTSVPKWFYPKFEIANNTILIILDDDVTIHQLWNERFKNLEPKISIINFTTPNDFLDWHSSCPTGSERFLYLFDLEFLGYNKTGINIIDDCNIQKNSVLVTSHFENIDIHTTCEKLGIKIIPKDLVVFVPIKVEQTNPTFVNSI